MTKILEDLKFLKTYHVEAQKEKEVQVLLVTYFESKDFCDYHRKTILVVPFWGNETITKQASAHMAVKVRYHDIYDFLLYNTK